MADGKYYPDKGMQLKVFAAGLPRSASSSLKYAFENVLNLGPCMHFSEVSRRIPLLKTLIDIHSERDDARRKELLHIIFDGFVSTADYPGCFFTDELLDMNPGMKVILNRRSSAATWVKSVSDSLGIFFTLRYHIITYLVPHSYWNYKVNVKCDSACQRLYGCNFLTEETFYRHNQYVRDVCKARDVPFLEWQPADGWEPLCKFLDVPVPDAPFPQTNETAIVKQMTKVNIRRGLERWAVALSIPAVGYIVYRQFFR